MKQCPECNRQFADSDTFCPFDGSALSVVALTDADLVRAGPQDKTRAYDAQTPPPEPAAQPTGHNIAIGTPMPETGPPPPAPAPGAYDYMIGTTLDARYKIERRIGEGGMGVVFLARHIVIEKPVAIKVLKREVARDQSVVRRFVQEAKAASRIGHPNIVDVTDFGTTPDGMTYSVMEYVEGDTLSTTIARERRLFVSRAVPIVTQIGRALGAAHDKGIVHRDLKPDNIFLATRAGRTDFVKIVDFGIAKVTSVKKDPTFSPRLTRQGTVFGTPEYMPPEQASGLPDTDHRVDIYALGIILYEMLIGRVPHKGDSLLRTLTMQINDPIEPPNKVAPELGLSDAFEKVLMRALAKDRDQRFQTMKELVTALEDTAGDIPEQIARKVSRPAQVEPAVAGPQEPTLSPQRSQPAPVATPASDTIPEPEPPEHLPGDPMFTGRGRPETLKRFDDLAPGDSRREPRRPSALPWVLAAILLIGAAGIGAVTLMRARDSDGAVARAPTEDAAPVVAVIDAGVVASDAAVTVAVAPDAGRRRKKGKGRQHVAVVDPRMPKGLVSIVVETRPRGGTLFMSNGAYGGTDGTTLTRRGGEKLVVGCKLAGYLPGRTELIFDGVTDLAICQMTRLKKCIPGVKNPFDDCTE